jgi:hypothetical protein
MVMKSFVEDISSPTRDNYAGASSLGIGWTQNKFEVTVYDVCAAFVLQTL